MSGPSASSCPCRALSASIEIFQAAVELRCEVWSDRWLPLSVAARWLGPWPVGFVDAECCIKQLVGVL